MGHFQQTGSALTQVAPSPLATLQADVEGAVRSAGQARSPATLEAYGRAWRSFRVWCRSVGRDACPAEPATVAVYLQHVADRRGYKPATLDMHLAAIVWGHRQHGHKFDRKALAVADVRAGLRRQKGVKPKQARPLLVEDLRAMVAPLGDSLIDTRDRALLLLSFAGAFRSSEILGALSGLRVSDCKRTKAGYELTVRRSKTDQFGAGMVKFVAPGSTILGTCPVEALDKWLSWTGHSKGGPLFPGIPGKSGQRCSGVALSRRDLQRIIIRRAERAGVDVTGLSGHSPRAGLVTEAVEAGVPLRDIQVVTGHKSVDVLLGYERRAAAKRRPAAKGLL